MAASRVGRKWRGYLKGRSEMAEDEVSVCDGKADSRMEQNVLHH